MEKGANKQRKLVLLKLLQPAAICEFFSFCGGGGLIVVSGVCVCEYHVRKQETYVIFQTFFMAKFVSLLSARAVPVQYIFL